MTSIIMTTETTRMKEIDFDALADRCLHLLECSKNTDHSASASCLGFNCYQQVFIGIAGTPGSGKSFIAEQVRDRINARNPNGNAEQEECVVIGMDGYHLTREQLKQKSEAGEYFKTDDGPQKMTYDELMARRGAAFTYCPEKFIQDLRKVKESGQGSLPIYSREQHDPIPDGVKIYQHNKIILVEGLYLLCLHDDDWKPLGDLWDDKWYIDVSMEETEKRLVKRHLKNWTEDKTRYWGGDDEAAATRKAESNDLKNAACIMKWSMGNASIVIENEVIPNNDDGHANDDGKADATAAT